MENAHSSEAVLSRIQSLNLERPSNVATALGLLDQIGPDDPNLGQVRQILRREEVVTGLFDALSRHEAGTRKRDFDNLERDIKRARILGLDESPVVAARLDYLSSKIPVKESSALSLEEVRQQIIDAAGGDINAAIKNLRESTRLGTEEDQNLARKVLKLFEPKPEPTEETLKPAPAESVSAPAGTAQASEVAEPPHRIADPNLMTVPPDFVPPEVPRVRLTEEPVLAAQPAPDESLPRATAEKPTLYDSLPLEEQSQLDKLVEQFNTHIYTSDDLNKAIDEVKKRQDIIEQIFQLLIRNDRQNNDTEESLKKERIEISHALNIGGNPNDLLDDERRVLYERLFEKAQASVQEAFKKFRDFVIARGQAIQHGLGYEGVTLCDNIDKAIFTEGGLVDAWERTWNYRGPDQAAEFLLRQGRPLSREEIIQAYADQRIKTITQIRDYHNTSKAKDAFYKELAAKAGLEILPRNPAQNRYEAVLIG